MYKLLKFILTILLLTLSLVVGTICVKGYIMYDYAVSECSISDRISDIRNGENYVKIDDISPVFIDALLSVEDRRFYEHIGVDRVSTSRAVVTNLVEGRFAEGGSTITQQLAKNMYFDRDKNFERKVAELFVVYHLEKEYSKDEILELYVNIIYFGDGYNGIKQAAEGYFGVEPSDLRNDEAILLAGLPQAPSYYALSSNLDGAKKRMEKVLEAMIDNSVMTEQEAKSLISLAEDIKLVNK